GTSPEDDNSGWGWGSTSVNMGPVWGGTTWGQLSGTGSYTSGGTTHSFYTYVSTATEGHPAYLWVELSPGSGSASDLVVALVNHTAVGGVDYGSLSTTYPSGSSGLYISGTIPTLEDSLGEGQESYEVHVQFSGHTESEVVLEGDIMDDDGTDPAAY